MSKIIEIEDRIESEKRKKTIAEKRRAIAPLIHFLQCSCCRMKCWRCGSQVELASPGVSSPDIPFSFCPTCREEFLEYQRSQQEPLQTTTPWHNPEWEAMWEKWIEYQDAVRTFHRSQEVRDLFADLRC
ncbi:MAG TPA: hypothetical protein PLG17_00460 [Thermodesulfobacteriota bacterium]|nr:hypothetical protein [Deltaproteobacteria bacterium]HNR12500.1 hypothetical protein [Thermodesulfobacteriota bacterium]HNU70494.1 hypothetical protein [Thermodesulfobacteriota bacterium]HOC38590.1 hypothetical protein [Thermodesulfobacteriota bacterium]HQO76961.1 hypothetical protein [Thermodesulfobacteriota bacterium]